MFSLSKVSEIRLKTYKIVLMSLRRCVFLFVLIFSQVVFSQMKNEYGSDASIIIPNGDLAAIVSSINDDSANNGNTKLIDQSTGKNGILITQVGDYNYAYANVASRTMDVQVSQEGDYNFYELIKMSGNKVKLKVEQMGASNYIMNNSLYSGYDINSENVQKGNDLTIQSIGSNSISSNMKIAQTGTGASVIVINN